MARWVFQEDIIDAEIIEKMTAFMTRMDIPWNRIKMVPFTRDLTQEKIDTNQPLIAIGSYDFTYKAIELGWKPGVWINENYDYRVWSQSGWKILNADGVVTNFGDVPFQAKPFFIRPCVDNKIFTGQVVDWGKYSGWLTKIQAGERDTTVWDVTLDSPIVYAAPKKIVTEYRFIVIDGKAVTGSMYKDASVGIYRNVDDRSELFDFVNEQASIWRPSDVFVMDIALSDGQLFVLEMGNFNAAGLYHCDLQKIVMTVEDFLLTSA